MCAEECAGLRGILRAYNRADAFHKLADFGLVGGGGTPKHNFKGQVKRVQVFPNDGGRGVVDFGCGCHGRFRGLPCGVSWMSNI